MIRQSVWVAGLTLLCTAIAQATDTSRAGSEPWDLSGDLSEACTCRVPCGCNFRDGSYPHRFCWTIFSLGIDKGHYGTVQLDGLHLVGAHGKKSVVWYIDQRATPEQFAALKTIGLQLKWHSELPAFVEAALVTQKVTDKGNDVEIAGHGGFAADYLMGLDGKNPIVVENGTVWNIPRSTKGKTRYLKYKDRHGNKLDFKSTNSNEGKFDWTDKSN